MSPEDLSESEDAAAYMEKVRREIADEVRRRRAAGDFPPSFERRLDEIFARFTPAGTDDGQFAETLKLADRSAYFDVKVPIGSRRTVKGAARYVLWHAEAWFVNYVVTQLNRFSSGVMQVLHLLDERISVLEKDMAVVLPPLFGDAEVLPPAADPTPYLEILCEEIASRGPAGLRVLHAECGSGALVAALCDAGVDAYGIDPGSIDADEAARAGLDVRRDEVLGHLESVPVEALGSLVLSGCVDRMAVVDRRRLVCQAESVVAPGGAVVVVGTMPSAWEETAGPVAADLAPGRPFYPETWVHLLAGVGLAEIGVRLDPPSGEPRSFAVVARKPAARSSEAAAAGAADRR